MKFVATMNMPSGGGNLVHQVAFEHHAKTLEELLREIAALNDSGHLFLMVDELYRENRDMIENGQTALSLHHIGKLRIFRD